VAYLSVTSSIEETYQQQCRCLIVQWAGIDPFKNEFARQYVVVSKSAEVDYHNPCGWACGNWKFVSLQIVTQPYEFVEYIVLILPADICKIAVVGKKKHGIAF